MAWLDGIVLTRCFGDRGECDNIAAYSCSPEPRSIKVFDAVRQFEQTTGQRADILNY